jgi:deoxycytidine triphosphate deaminase
MIRPFRERLLHPASYDLTLGPRCLVRGEERILSAKDPVLTIPPNSIAFISSRERLLMPHWLIARFNLATQWLFYGLLMGAGPQVDPGFQGVLSAPLHNIASRPVTMRLGDPVIRMDFTKTGLDHLSGVPAEQDLYSKVLHRQICVGHDEPLKFWERDKRWREPTYFAPQSRSVQSSLEQLDNRLEKAERTLRLGSIACLVVAATIVAASAALAAVSFTYADGRVNDKTSSLEAQIYAGSDRNRSTFKRPQRSDRRDPETEYTAPAATTPLAPPVNRGTAWTIGLDIAQSLGELHVRRIVRLPHFRKMLGYGQ